MCDWRSPFSFWFHSGIGFSRTALSKSVRDIEDIVAAWLDGRSPWPAYSESVRGIGDIVAEALQGEESPQI